MKLVTKLSFTCAIALGCCAPALALPRFIHPDAGIKTQGVVETPFPIIGSGHLVNVTEIKTESGEVKSYPVDPNTQAAIKFDKGMKVVLDTTHLVTGKVTRLSRDMASVQLDGNNASQSYFLSREQRRYLSVGDRIAVTPYLRLVRLDLVGLMPNYLWPVK